MPESNTERTSVKTYVPEYQAEAWADHAEELGMSKSEFVRSMVQAGRNGFEGVDSGSDPQGSEAEEGVAFEGRVVSALDGETRSWDELLAALTDDVEARLDEALSDLQAENRVQYSGREGGYTLVDDER